MANERRGGAPTRRAIALIATVALSFLPACSGAGTASTATQARNAATKPAASGNSATPAPGALGRGSPVPSEPGWQLKMPAYLGRYRMTWSSDQVFAGSAILTLFMRPVTKPKKATFPSGVLSVFGRDQTTVLYITKLRHTSTDDLANVSTGNYTYPPIGQIRLARFDQRHHTLMLVFRSAYSDQIELSFSRYSDNPHP